MSRIDIKFNELHRKNKSAFIPFLTAGYPSLSVTEKLVVGFEKAGADIVELGIPFSDPLADGPAIQDSSFKALQKGVTINKIFNLVSRIRKKSQIPIVLMTYYNPILHYGEEKFLRSARRCGVDGLIIPDLPPEEASQLIISCRQKGISTIFFVSPTTTKERMKKIIARTTGFIYYVSLTGVTGARRSLSQGLLNSLQTIKKNTSKPVCAGFGISNAGQIKVVSQVADGVIVGSAIIHEINKHLRSKKMVQRVTGFTYRLANSVL